MILAGDIGGTNTRLALFDQTNIVSEEKFSSKDFKGLEEIVVTFLKGRSVTAACFGIAGPVRDGKCKATNLPWEVDAKRFKIAQVRLVNDLEANANGLKLLKPGELYCLQEGKRQVGNQALISAGTGLGEAGLYWDGTEHKPFACEGGHSDFAPRNEAEVELFYFLQKKFGHVSYERVVSGMGIELIYEFLSKEKKSAPEICKSNDPMCVKAVDWFLSLYGAEAGNVALKFLSLGGLYIGGGIAPKLLDRLKKSDFVKSFVGKGRFQELLASIPIYVVLNDDAALLGAAAFARGL